MYMPNKIFFSPKAKSDLCSIHDYIVSEYDDEQAADSIISGILNATERLSEFPLSGAKLFLEDMDTGYRYVLCKKYMAFYRFDNGTVYVDRVLYGGMDYLSILFP